MSLLPRPFLLAARPAPAGTVLCACGPTAHRRFAERLAARYGARRNFLLPAGFAWRRPRPFGDPSRVLKIGLTLRFATSSFRFAVPDSSAYYAAVPPLRPAFPVPGPVRTVIQTVTRSHRIERFILSRPGTNHLEHHVFVPRQAVATPIRAIATPIRRSVAAPACRRLELVLRRETVPTPAAEARTPSFGSAIHAVATDPRRPPWLSAPGFSGDWNLTPAALNRLTDEVVRSIDRRLLSYRERMGGV